MNILVYGDSLSWGIIPNSRDRLVFAKRWTGVLQQKLGDECRVIEECLNGRTTIFNDVTRPQRNGLETVKMVLESHSPIDLMIIMLGINDFQDVIGANEKESAAGLANLIRKVQSIKPEPMAKPVQLLVIIPPEIKQPLGQMAVKFSDFEKGKGSETEYLKQIKALKVDTLLASDHVSLSQIDGIHLDEKEHFVLGQVIAERVLAISNTLL